MSSETSGMLADKKPRSALASNVHQTPPRSLKTMASTICLIKRLPSQHSFKYAGTQMARFSPALMTLIRI